MNRQVETLEEMQALKATGKWRVVGVQHAKVHEYGTYTVGEAEVSGIRSAATIPTVWFMRRTTKD